MLDSIISLSFNKLSTTSRCLESVVRDTDFPGDTELIVVDNGSTDGSKEWLENELTALCASAGISYRLIANSTNVGCSTARNQALAVASGECITFIDNDVAPQSPDWLSRLRSRLYSAPDIGMVGAKMLYPPTPAPSAMHSIGGAAKGFAAKAGRAGVPSPAAGMEHRVGVPSSCSNSEMEPPEPSKLQALNSKFLTTSPSHHLASSCGMIQCAGVGISRRGHVCFLGRGESDSNPVYSTPREVQCLISACMMIRGCLVRDFGGFDESYNPVQFEDFDLCYRFREHGWKAWFEPSARMTHYESTTTAGSPSIRNAAVVVRNGLRFQKAWRHMFSVENGPSEDECRWKTIGK